MAAKKKKSGLPVLLVLVLILNCVCAAVIVHMHKSQYAVAADASAQIELGKLVAKPPPLFDGSQDRLRLVNKENVLDKDYVPDELVRVNDVVSGRPDDISRLTPEAADAFNELTAGAADDGITIKLTSGYRSYSYQSTLYNYYLRTKGTAWTEAYSAKPGASEHQTGLAADVSSPSVGYSLKVSYGDTEEGKWLAAHAHEYGFILRYQKGKEDITGYSYEPWHIRYVGKDAAGIIYDEDLVYEEFVEKYCN